MRGTEQKDRGEGSVEQGEMDASKYKGRCGGRKKGKVRGGLRGQAGTERLRGRERRETANE